MIPFWRQAALTFVLAFFACGVRAQTSEGILFYDDFERPGGVNDLTPWKVLGGLWSVSNGMLLGTTNGLPADPAVPNPTNHHSDIYVTNSWNDYSVEVTASVPIDGYGWAVAGRLDPVVGSYYELFLYANYDPPQQWRLKLTKHAHWGPTGWDGVAWTPDVSLIVDTVNRTIPHTVKVTFIGNRVLVDFDGVNKMDVVDNNVPHGGNPVPPYLSGGVLVGMYSKNDAVLSVEEVIVRQLGPIATDQVVETPEDTATNLMLTGSIVTGTKTFAIGTGPTHGTLGTLNPTTGEVTYTPTPGYVGPDSFNFTVSDGTLYATGMVSITVTPPVLVHQTIAGVVSYYAVYPPSGPSAERLEDVTINLTGDTNLNTLTLGDGSFDLAGIASGGTHGITPVKTNDSPVAHGVDSFDQFLIQRHILGRTLFDSPYKRLAADVDGAGNIDSFDQFLIQRLILGRATQFPLGLWRFVPADYIFPDANNPWAAPTNLWHTNLVADVVGEDFVAIKLGDVDNGWTASVGGASLVQANKVTDRVSAANQSPEVVFQVDSLVARPGERVKVGVMVRDFNQVASAQFTLGWNPRVLRYSGVSDQGLKGGSIGTSLVESGKLMFAWYDAEGTGQTVADGTRLFAVNFEVVGEAGSVTAVELFDSPTQRKVWVDAAVATFRAYYGRVRVLDPAHVQIGGATWREGKFQLTVPTVSGQRYILEFTDELPATNWVVLPGVEGDGTVLGLIDPGATNHQRFYRVRIE